MRFDLAVSLRYFRSRRSEGTVSFIAAVAIGGVTLGVAALIVAMSVMNGYRANLVRAMAGALPHVSLHAFSGGQAPRPDELPQELLDRIAPVSISQYALHETLLSSLRQERGEGSVRAVLVRAVDIEIERKVPGFLNYLDDGSEGWAKLPLAERMERATALTARLLEPTVSGAVPVLLGTVLAERLGVGLGQQLTPLDFPKSGEGFTPLPAQGRLEVVGYVHSGIVTFDEWVVILPLHRLAEVFPQAAQRLSVGLRLRDPMKAGPVTDALRAEMMSTGRGVYVYSWLESNKGLFQVIQVQKTMLFLILLLIVVLAFFGMVSSLVMLVAEKTREITILQALGLRAGVLRRIFIWQGLFIGFSGTGLGVALGLGICRLLAAAPFLELPPGVYPGSDRVPVEVASADVLGVVAATLLICLVATIFPARKAGALQPADGLRFA